MVSNYPKYNETTTKPRAGLRSTRMVRPCPYAPPGSSPLQAAKTKPQEGPPNIHAKVLAKCAKTFDKDTKVQNLWPRLLQNGIFGQVELEKIQCDAGRISFPEQRSNLRKALARKSPKMWTKFLRCLEDSGQSHFRSILEETEYSLRHNETEFALAPRSIARKRRWSTSNNRPKKLKFGHGIAAYSGFLGTKNPEIPISDEHSKKHQMHEKTWVKQIRERYGIKPFRVIIINNEHFQNMPQRDNADLGFLRLHSALTMLGFDIFEWHDFTAEGIRGYIELEARFDINRCCDVVIYIVMSHSTRDHIWGIDGERVDIMEEIYKPLKDGLITKRDGCKLFLMYVSAPYNNQDCADKNSESTIRGVAMGCKEKFEIMEASSTRRSAIPRDQPWFFEKLLLLLTLFPKKIYKSAAAISRAINSVSYS